MKITVIGSGYVGLVTGICLAKTGHEIICVDKDQRKISNLQENIIPIFEPGLSDLLQETVANKKISFSCDLSQACQESDVFFIAVGTPQDEDGSADLSYVLAAAKEIALNSKNSKLIITKSTVPAQTGEKIQNLLRQVRPDLKFDVASNPEFLREGSAISDFMNPDRIVVGVENEKVKNIFREIYQFFPSEKLVFTDIITAELIKYAANSFLATKITFINQMATMCETVGGNIKDLAHAMGMDERIGNKFLNPGPGFGGSCFPKDVLALQQTAKENNLKLPVIDAVLSANQQRQEHLAKKIEQLLGANISEKKIALLGLAFKGNTDDVRYSPAIKIAKLLLPKVQKIFAHDFAAIENSRKEFKDFSNIEFCSDLYQACNQADFILVATEWKEYAAIDLKKINVKKIYDLRNLFDAKTMAELGFEYYHIGQKF